MSYSGEFVDESTIENDSGNCQINDDGETAPSDNIRFQQNIVDDGLSKGIRFFSSGGVNEYSIKQQVGGSGDTISGAHLRFETNGVAHAKVFGDGNTALGGDIRATHRLCIGGQNNPILDIHQDTSPDKGAYYRGGEYLGVGYGELGLYTNNGTNRRLMCAFQKVNATDYVCNAASTNFQFNNWVSDDRLKENETPITDAVSTLNKLKPVNYDMKRTFDDTDTATWKPDSGLIVQDVWYDAPELRRMIYVGEGGNPAEQNDKPDYPSWGENPSYFHYHKMIGYLVKGIQELSAENESLKTRVSALENPQP